MMTTMKFNVKKTEMPKPRENVAKPGSESQSEEEAKKKKKPKKKKPALKAEQAKLKAEKEAPARGWLSSAFLASSSATR